MKGKWVVWARADGEYCAALHAEIGLSCSACGKVLLSVAEDFREDVTAELTGEAIMAAMKAHECSPDA